MPLCMDVWLSLSAFYSDEHIVVLQALLREKFLKVERRYCLDQQIVRGN